MRSDKNIIELKKIISYRNTGGATIRNWYGISIADCDEGRRMGKTGYPDMSILSLEDI